MQQLRLSVGLSSLEKINAAVLDMEPVNETAGFMQRGILMEISETFSHLF